MFRINEVLEYENERFRVLSRFGSNFFGYRSIIKAPSPALLTYIRWIWRFKMNCYTESKIPIPI